MKRFVLVSDVHITSKQPKARLDNYTETQYNKIKFMLEWSAQHNVDAILLAGDVFDTVFVNHETIKTYIELFNTYRDPSCLVAAVYGQHDLRYHSLNKINDTPLSVLLAGINGIRLTSDPVIVDNVALYGLSWGEKFPTPVDNNHYNILVAHITVINEEKLFPGQNDFYSAKRLLYNTAFDMIVTGDNHQRFIVNYKNKYLFNNGSVMRMERRQADFKPSFTYVEIEDKKLVNYELIYFPIQDNVFKEETKIVNERESEVEKFLSSMLDDPLEKQINFLSILHKSLSDEKDEELRYWVDKIIEIYASEHSSS